MTSCRSDNINCSDQEAAEGDARHIASTQQQTEEQDDGGDEGVQRDHQGDVQQEALCIRLALLQAC